MREGWESMRLTNFVWFQRGFDLPRNNFVEGNVPVYGSTSILGYHNVSKVKAPGIITGRSGTLGKFQFANEDFWPHNTSLWVKDFKDNDEKFAYYLLQTLDFTLFNSGGAVPTLNRNLLTAYIVNIPPLETQRKIASILSGYDDLIENNLKRIKILEEMAQQTYEEWFVRMRFPGYETAVMNEETGLPEGWEKVKLGKLWEIQSSKRIYLSDYVEFGIPFFRGKEISQKGGNSNVSDLLYISEFKFNELKSKFGAPKEGDILLTAVGTLGNLYMVKQTDDEFYFKDGNLIWLKFNSTYSSYFLFYTLKNSSFQNHLNNIAIGSSQKALTIKGLKESEIIYPSNEIIMDFDRITKPINLSIENFQSQNQRFREARDLLLPRLMMGIVEV